MFGGKASDYILEEWPITISVYSVRILRLTILATLLAAMFISVVPTSAQSPTRVVSDDDVNAIAKEIYCPTCENITLDVCETLACEDWRGVIRTKLAEGQSKEQIKDYFIEQYGDRGLADPPIEGMTQQSLAVPTSAQSPTRIVSDNEVNAIARDLFCPVCENTPLDVCETQACADWREVIRVKLAEGQSDDEIKGYFAEQYGVRALAEPPAEGVTLPVWLVPIIAIPVAILLFSLYLRNLRTSAARAAASPDSGPGSVSQANDAAEQEQDPYAARIERELREM
jgi:cytochrome c-type biogenesis protein CcmH